jgi:hypothetical protein
MNVETGTEATQFPEKVYINGIFVAVRKEIHKKSVQKDIRKKKYAVLSHDFCNSSTDALTFLQTR